MAKTEGQRSTNMMRKDLIPEKKSMTVALTSYQKDSSRRKRRLTTAQCILPPYHDLRDDESPTRKLIMSACLIRVLQ